MSDEKNISEDNFSGPTIVAERRVPWVDPTPNVIAQFKAEARRQDDLREATDKLTQARLDCTKEIISLRADFQRTIDVIRDSYAKQLSEAEAKRIDAIRSVDVQAVQIASQRASEQATVLANQVQQSAETLRNLVATTATATTNSVQQVTTQLSTRIAALEQTSYQTAGRQSFADPAMMELQASVKALLATSQTGQGKSEGISASWGIFAGAAVIALALIFGVAQISSSNKNGSSPTPTAVAVVPITPK